MNDAMFWESKGNNKVQCLLCPQLCVISDGKTGFCRVRKNQAGKLYTLNYSKCAAYGLDPVEKKPLYHFYPGSNILSVGTFGCNLRCGFCQNWQIAHGSPSTVELSPQKLVDIALEEQDSNTSVGIAYTYSEPFMWYEYVYDTAKIAREKGLKNVLVTNGFINPEPLKEILPYIDAMNIDVKAFNNRYYNETCVGELNPVLKTVEIASMRCHVEITTLLVTGLNDDVKEISDLVDWLAGIDREIPLHFSRYFPNYKMDLPPTPIHVMKKAREIAQKKLSYVYLGNVTDPEAGNTYCPDCGELIIERSGYRVIVRGMKDKKCLNCGREITCFMY